ncbi:hypothetical protein HYV43_01885 [Candidatus Micrarchaeota archaeon]|nr:hypothetical protein [Candidatus Micrarchaeota archaeon]
MTEPLVLNGKRRALLLIAVGGSLCARNGALSEIQNATCPNCGREFSVEDALEDVPYIDFYFSGGRRA